MMPEKNLQLEYLVRSLVKPRKWNAGKWERVSLDSQADTPRTPSPKSVDFQQFCDRLRTNLPGDSHGRESFDTSARFIAGDPGARFGAAAPLEYEVPGEIESPPGVDL